MAEQLFQALISGISVGSIYAIVGLGFFVVYSTARVLNFSQGEFVMLGGMLMVTFYEAGVPLLPSLLLAGAVSGLGGALLHRLVIRPAGEAPIMTLILLTVGASMVIRGAALLGWGWQVRSLPAFLDSKAFYLGPAFVSGQVPWVVGVGALMVLGLFFFFDRTLQGKAMRSCAEEPLGARLQGISVKGMVLLSFVLAALLAGIAGAVMTPLTTTQYDIGIPLTIKGLLAAFAGGMGRAQGVIAGGLLLGFMEALAAVFISSGMKNALVMTVFVGILIARPQGLVGAPSR